jgi:hypothetical protein
MRALSINFELKAPGARVGWGRCALGSLVLAAVVGAEVLVYQETERQARATPEAGPKRAAWVLPRGVPSETEALAGALAVVGHLAGPGERLFVTLEAIDEPDVALLALTPDTKARTLRIQAEAKNVDAMLSYLRVLEQSRAFT